MSRTRIVGGTLTIITGGEHNIYSETDIVFTAGTTITETAEGVISFGEPKDPPKREENTNLLVDIGLDIFVNEDGKEIGRVKKQGIKGKEAPIVTDVPQATDLAVEISIDNNNPEIGKEVKFTIIATNNGPETATRVTVEDILPSGYTFICQETEKGTWEAPVWTIGDLASGEKATLKIEATVKEGEYTSLAKIDGQEQDSIPANNSSKITTRVFLVKTTQTKFDSGAPPAGITKPERKETEQFIVTNNGIIDKFTSECIAYTNTVEIQSKTSTRQAMVTIVEQDNGNGGKLDANNREYGGYIKSNGEVVQVTPGPIRDLKKATFAYISFDGIPLGTTIFHSHPSGKIHEDSSENKSSMGGVQTLGGTTEDARYNDAPSNEYKNENGVVKKDGDVPNAKQKIEYVFARSNKTVYIYNNKGVLATIPHEYFITFKK
jgi:uncharacterized repeat protein (TIGR01451 family)